MQNDLSVSSLEISGVHANYVRPSSSIQVSVLLPGWDSAYI